LQDLFKVGSVRKTAKFTKVQRQLLKNSQPESACEQYHLKEELLLNKTDIFFLATQP
jgi:hypothetical protein